MTKQTIDIGAKPDDGKGDTGRVAFDKVNDNFTELYDLTTPMSVPLVQENTTNSTSPTTGSIQTDGGLGVAKDTVIAGDLTLGSTTGSARFTLKQDGDSAADGFGLESTGGGTAGFYMLANGTFVANSDYRMTFTSRNSGFIRFTSNTDLFFRIGLNDDLFVEDSTGTKLITINGTSGNLSSTAGIGLNGATAVGQATAMTVADASAVNSGDATTDTVINNMRTRINELEAMLDATTGIGVVA